MKETLLKILVVIVAICSALFVLSACGDSPISFKLNFIVDNEIVKTIDTTGNEKIALPNDPQKDGYAFDGWFWDKDVWEKPFTANSLLYAPLSSDMSVYAKFTKNHEHNYTATVTAPTCTEKGYTTYTCACGESYKDDYVDELGHNYSAVVTEPTCTEQGYTTHTCSRCKDSYIDTYINELEHEFTNYVSDNNATYDSDGTKTAYCNHGCSATNTITAENTKLKSGIVFKTLNVDKDLNVYGKVPNTQPTFSFINEVEVKGNATFVVSTDIYGIQQIPTKTVPLEIGDNTFYITETVGNNIRLFTVTVRRRPIYTVSFNTNGGTTVVSQQVEEDSPAIESTTTKAGYTFAGWDYDFTTPITNSLTVNASWTANIDTPYKVEYYLQNLDDNHYTIYETENLTGTTDTTANAEIKEYEHFTHTTISESKESGNINADGSGVLKVFYTRDMYNVNFFASENVTLSADYSGQYKYGYIIPKITATFNNYLGYEWQGWYNGNDFLTLDYIIPPFEIDKGINYTATCVLKEEMSNFTFTTTATDCKITGVKDNSVTEIFVPDYVTEIEENAFKDCNKINKITLPFVGKSYGSDSNKSQDYLFCYIFKKSYSENTNNNDAQYTDTGFDRSEYRHGIVSGYFTIHYHYFYYNYKIIEDIVITGLLSAISSYAFYNTKFCNITLSKNIKEIYSYAFYNCSYLTNIYYEGTKEEWSKIEKQENWKLDVPSDCTVHCSDGDIEISEA